MHSQPATSRALKQILTVLAITTFGAAFSFAQEGRSVILADKHMELATGIDEAPPATESVTLSIGWPGYFGSKIESTRFSPAEISSISEEVVWSSENLQIGIIPEPSFLAIVVAVVAGALFLNIKRRRHA